MHPDVKHLIELQALDLRMLDLRARLADFPKQLAAVEARVAAARADLTRARESLTGSLKDRKTFEMDVEDWKGKVRKYKDQIYEVKTNEAYKALQHEIEAGEKQIAAAEDRLLERMVAGEDYERQVKAAERTLAETEAAAEADRQRLQSEKAAAETELAALETERGRTLEQIPEDVVDHYQRIARRHGGVALSEVRDETCTLCRVRVRPHVFQALRNPAGQEIIHCESCTRILYYAEAAAVAAPAPAAAQSSEP